MLELSQEKLHSDSWLHLTSKVFWLTWSCFPPPCFFFSFFWGGGGGNNWLHKNDTQRHFCPCLSPLAFPCTHPICPCGAKVAAAAGAGRAGGPCTCKFCIVENQLSGISSPFTHDEIFQIQNTSELMPIPDSTIFVWNILNGELPNQAYFESKPQQPQRPLLLQLQTSVHSLPTCRAALASVTGKIHQWSKPGKREVFHKLPCNLGMDCTWKKGVDNSGWHL